MIWTVCTDLTVERAVVIVVRCQETMYDSHNSSILPQNCINHQLRINDHHLLVYYLRAMNGMIGDDCLDVMFCVTVVSNLCL